MNQKEMNQWRTVVVALSLGAVNGGAFWWGTGHQSELVGKMFGDLTWGSVLMLGIVAGKALGQHAAKNGGLRGLLGALGGQVPQVQPEAPRASP